MRRILSLLPVLLTFSVPAFSQADVKAAFLKHLKTSKDFTLKVAEAMPEADYQFKLTPPQMSFAQPMHLSQGFEYFLTPFTGKKPDGSTKSFSKKADVVAFVKASFDRAIDQVSKLSPDALGKVYPSENGNLSGLELLMGLLDHTTHHRASSEMYLRAKGITPPEYEF